MGRGEAAGEVGANFGLSQRPPPGGGYGARVSGFRGSNHGQNLIVAGPGRFRAARQRAVHPPHGPRLHGRELGFCLVANPALFLQLPQL